MWDLRDWENRQDDLRDEMERWCVQEIFKELTAFLNDHEEYFLQKIMEKLRLNGQESVKKIKAAIKDVISNDEGVKWLEIYGKYSKFITTWANGLNPCIDEFQKKIVGWLSDEEVNRGVMNYLAFLQRGREYVQAQGREIHRGEDDIENFILFIKEANKRQDPKEKKIFSEEGSLSKFERFLRIVSNTIDTSTIDVQRIDTNKQLVVSLEGETINFPSKKLLSEQELEDFGHIEDRLKDIVWYRNYWSFVEDFFEQVREQKGPQFKSVERIIEGLVERYSIVDDIDALSDYLLRLKDMVFKDVSEIE